MKNATVKLTPYEANNFKERLAELCAYYNNMPNDQDKILGILLLRLKITLEKKLVIYGSTLSISVNIETVYLIRLLYSLGYFSDIKHNNIARRIIDKHFTKKIKK
ncbi:MAG: hypothetical protein AB7G44_03535 [Bacteroidia bacterium]